MSVPLSWASPVGPKTNAAELSSTVYPDAIIVALCTVTWLDEITRLRRVIVPVLVPSFTLDTKTRAWSPPSSIVRSQGPLSLFVVNGEGDTGLPFRSRSSSDPGGTITPPDVGRLPTRTKPRLSTPSAVVNPSGGVPWKNGVAVPGAETKPLGVSLMIVVPVPWALLLALLLKFDTKMSPGASGPPDGKPSGTNATP